jgi:hypothetical protein
MSEYYRHRLRQLRKLLEPGLRRMLFLSFVLHLIVPVILSGVLKVTHERPRVPVYRVNLVNKPVKDPRAGRPDASPIKQKKKKVKPKPAARKIPVARKVPTKTVKPKPVPAKKVAPKVVKPKVKPDKTAETSLRKRLAEMKAEAERKAKLEKLKALIAAQQEDIGRPDVEAPVGEPDGTGKEIGVSSIRYVEGYITEQWRLSPYQSSLDLEAEIKVYYSKEGKQGHWEMVKKSGNTFFDDTVKRAIIRSRDLGQSLPVGGEFEIIFNLKDLQNR